MFSIMGVSHWLLLSALYWSASGLRVQDYEPTKKTQLTVELNAGTEGWNSEHTSVASHATSSQTSLVVGENEFVSQEFLIDKAGRLLQGRLSPTVTEFRKDGEATKQKNGIFNNAMMDSPDSSVYCVDRLTIRDIGVWKPSSREPGWMQLHQQFVKEAESYTPAKPGQHKLVWMGDSYVEQFRGTNLGQKTDGKFFSPMTAHLKNVSKVFQETYAKAYPDPMVFGIWADTIEQQWWRIENGEISPAMANDEGLLINLLIHHKTLSLGDESVKKTTKGIIDLSRRILEKTKGKLLINSHFPVGSEHFNQLLTEKVFPEVERLTKTQLMEEFPGRVDYADCAREFRKLTKEKQPEAKPLKWEAKSNFFQHWAEGDLKTLYLDGVHPSYKGHQVIADCVLPKLKQLETLGA